MHYNKKLNKIWSYLLCSWPKLILLELEYSKLKNNAKKLKEVVLVQSKPKDEFSTRNSEIKSFFFFSNLYF
jgi:hypothetical protein